MAEKHTAHKKGSYQVVSGPPDCCVVNGATVPFDICRALDKASLFSPNVNVVGTRILRVGDIIGGVDGDAGAGVCSGTSLGAGDNVILTGAPKVFSAGLPVARHDSLVAMNGGNTVGHIVIGESAPLVPVNGGVVPCNNPPKSSPWLEKLQKEREALGFMDPDQLDEYVRFNDTSKILDGWISEINVTNDGSFWGAVGNYTAQAGRALLGFGKDAVLGLGNLLYSGAKNLTPGGMLLGQIDAAILAEQVNLGNICLETLKQAAKAAGKELSRPVIEAWEKGNKVEAVTRAALEIGSLAFAIGDIAKLATAARAGEVGAAAGRVEGALARTEGALGRESGALGREAGAAGRQGAGAVPEGGAPRTAPEVKPPTPEAKPPTPEAKPPTPEAKPATPEAKPASPEAKPTSPEGKPTSPDSPEGKPKSGDEGGGGDKPPDGEGKPAADEGGGKKDGDNGSKVRKKGESKGAFGERMTDEEMARRGYEKISSDKNPNAKGIDGVYKNKNPPPEYVISESKYGSSQLGNKAADGRQMSDSWINGDKTGFDRLADAVGRDQAAAIRNSIANGGVDKVLARIDSAGNVTFSRLNAGGFVTGPWP